MTAEEQRPVRVFMSYRRADDRHFIGRLHDRLCDAFGEERVFRDIDSIPVGTNFRQVILRTLDEVDAVVAVIGPNWARPSAGPGTAHTDYMFLELIEALKQGKPVVPVLIEDTMLPSFDGLPTDLAPLREINAMSVHADPSFRRDSEHLVESINAIVGEDRARLLREQEAAADRERRLQEERAQREELAAQLRAEERAARARLAELEEQAARRQIQQERDRLEAIAEQLRTAEGAVAPPGPPPSPPSFTATAPPPSPPPASARHDVEPATQRGHVPAHAAMRTDLPAFELLILAALVLGIVGLFLDRSVIVDDSTITFNEMTGTTVSDVMVMLFTLTTAVPLFLGRRPVEQRFVLAGVALSTFLFDFIGASGTVRFGTDYAEGSWNAMRVAELACLAGAYGLLRRRAVASAPRRRYVAPLVGITIGCGVLLVVSTVTDWNDAQALIDNSFVPDRSPLVVWIVLLAALPVATTIALAGRGTYGAQVCLATVATLAILNFFAQSGFIGNEITGNGSMWVRVGLVYVVLAAVAWWLVVARAKTD